MRPPASFCSKPFHGAQKISATAPTDFFNKIDPSATSPVDPPRSAFGVKRSHVAPQAWFYGSFPPLTFEGIGAKGAPIAQSIRRRRRSCDQFDFDRAEIQVRMGFRELAAYLAPLVGNGGSDIAAALDAHVADVFDLSCCDTNVR